MRRRSLFVVFMATITVFGCAPRYQPMEFASPTGTTQEQANLDKLECELIARRAVPEMRMPFPSSGTPPTDYGTSAAGGFAQGLSHGLQNLPHALRINRAGQEQHHILATCMRSRGYTVAQNGEPEEAASSDPAPVRTGMSEEEVEATLRLGYLMLACHRLNEGRQMLATPVTQLTEPPTEEFMQDLINAHDFLWNELGVDPVDASGFYVDGKEVTVFDVPESVWKQLKRTEESSTLSNKMMYALDRMVCADAVTESGAYDLRVIQERIEFHKEALRESPPT